MFVSTHISKLWEILAKSDNRVSKEIIMMVKKEDIKEYYNHLHTALMANLNIKKGA